MQTVAALIGLGTNLPWQGQSGPDLLRRAAAAMEAEGLAIRKASSIWKTPAWPPGSGQPDYHNAVVELEPLAIAPEELFATLRRIEQACGRERRERWGPRTLDLDIIGMEDLAGSFGEVILPHPRMHERVFVLAPLAEIAPDWRHPILHETAETLLGRLSDRSTAAVIMGAMTRL